MQDREPQSVERAHTPLLRWLPVAIFGLIATVGWFTLLAWLLYVVIDRLGI